MSEQDVPEAIRAALGAHTTLTLAYADEDGPQACAVFYALAAATESPGDSEDPVSGQLPFAPSLFFVTSPTTRHGRALLSGGTDGTGGTGGTRVAFTAQRDGQDWTALTGVQGRGVCRVLAGADRAAARHTYGTRFPDVERDARLRQAMDRTDFWELRPDWLRLIDNGRGFGHRTEWPPRAPEA
ncbi:pyridoxamine 5'-phosphate oxidase [Streptomyces gamaensis]|uniref:Pyridoxamine 5'-phosphate oxidase n=1 Tax=Streptomyces gamaensis TaxID=1763542 RepID=A0ABW0Z9F6_9ACTN